MVLFSLIAYYLCLLWFKADHLSPFFSSLVSSLNIFNIPHVAPISFCGFRSFSFFTFIYLLLSSHSSVCACCRRVLVSRVLTMIFLSLTVSCAGNEVQCRDKTCVRGAKCDGRSDCSDNSDEEGCRKGSLLFVLVPIVYPDFLIASNRKCLEKYQA